MIDMSLGIGLKYKYQEDAGLHEHIARLLQGYAKIWDIVVSSLKFKKAVKNNRPVLKNWYG